MSSTHKIKLLKGFLRRDLRVLSDMAPFVIMEMGGISKTSMVDQKGGKKPTWNETLQFKTTATVANLLVYDSDKFGDQLIGKGRFDINKMQANENQAVVDIYHEQKVVGKIYVKVISKPIIIELKQKSKSESLQQNQKIDEEGKNIFQQAAINLLSPKKPMTKQAPMSSRDQTDNRAFEGLFNDILRKNFNQQTQYNHQPTYHQYPMGSAQPQASYGNQGYFPQNQYNVMAPPVPQYSMNYPQPTAYSYPQNVQYQPSYPHPQNYQKQNIYIINHGANKPKPQPKSFMGQIKQFFN